MCITKLSRASAPKRLLALHFPSEFLVFIESAKSKHLNFFEDTIELPRLCSTPHIC